MTVLYARYNRHRLPEFQLETRVVRERGRLFVEKRALTPAARPHVAALARLHAELAPVVSLPLRLPELLEVNEQAIRFEFIQAPRLDGIWLKAVLARDRPAFLARLDEYHHLLTHSFPPASRLAIPPATAQLFAGVDFEALAQERHFLARSFLDLIPDNILVRDNAFYLVDNEWAVEGSLPVSFVLYRGLFEFFVLKCSGFGLESFVSFEQALDRLGISGAMASVYRVMEERFQDYVCGPHKLHYAKMAYAKPVLTVSQLDESLRKVTLEAWAQVQSLQEKDRLILQLLDNEKKVSHMVMSDEWEWARRFRRVLDRRCPPGSRRRAWALRLLDRLAGPEIAETTGLTGPAAHQSNVGVEE